MMDRLCLTPNGRTTALEVMPHQDIDRALETALSRGIPSPCLEIAHRQGIIWKRV